ncbi:MAG: hypothetical protein AAGG59_04570 [Bacteroidota bacterium]
MENFKELSEQELQFEITGGFVPAWKIIRDIEQAWDDTVQGFCDGLNAGMGRDLFCQ